MPETNKKQWYVLHTYSGYEKKVKENLESRAQSMGMSNYIFRIVVPEQERQKIKDGRATVVVENDFPGYVLVEMVMTDEAWYVVRNTPGVTGFVGSHGGGSKPTPMLPEEANLILERMNEIDKPNMNVDFEVGESVKIADDALSGLKNVIGKVISIEPEKQKIKVSVTMFGRETLVELDCDQVSKL